MKLHELPLGPCVCGHPASWHAMDRASEPPCLRYDHYPVQVKSVFGHGPNGERIIWDSYPVCETCEGYQEDRHALYQELCGGVASRRHIGRVAGVALG